MNTLTFSPAVAITIAEQQASAAIRESSRRRLVREVRHSDPLPRTVAAHARRPSRRTRLVARLGL